MEVDDCPICLCVLEERVAKLDCGHSFHIECIDQHSETWFKKRQNPKCPICRNFYLGEDDIEEIETEDEVEVEVEDVGLSLPVLLASTIILSRNFRENSLPCFCVNCRIRRDLDMD